MEFDLSSGGTNKVRRMGDGAWGEKQQGLDRN